MTFRAMNTDVSVVAPTLDEGDLRALERDVADCFEAAERRYSRFRPESELSRLNRALGPVSVSRELFSALVRARRWAEVTDGRFDPGVGGALVAQGYDQSFAPGALDRPEVTGAVTPRPASVLELSLDPATRTVLRPAHVTLDLGGMIKGATADAAASLLPSCGAVDAGGDLALRGTDPNGEGWTLDVEDPRDPSKTLCTFAIHEGGVATSATNRRRWRVGGSTRHHLIDPRTGAPSATDLAQVTVVCEGAERAEVLAKVALLSGRALGRAWLEAQGACGVLVDHEGRCEIAGGLEVRFDA